jgi:hypothetical protein
MHKADTYFYGKEKWTKAQVDGKVAWVANQLRLMNAGTSSHMLRLLTPRQGWWASRRSGMRPLSAAPSTPPESIPLAS